MRVAGITYKNITRTPVVSDRIAIARQAQGMIRGANPVYSVDIIKAAQLRSKVIEMDAGGEAVQLCSSGNLSAFMFACARREFICVDQTPFFNRTLGWATLGETPQELLARGLLGKMHRGYWHNNEDIAPFKEVSIFMLLESIAMGAEQLEVFEANEVQGLYKLVFDLQQEKYCVHFIQSLLDENSQIPFLDPTEAGIVMLKAGDGVLLKGPSYKYLESLVPKLKPGSLVITDRAIKNSLLIRRFELSDEEMGIAQSSCLYNFPDIIEDAKYGELRLLYQVK